MPWRQTTVQPRRGKAWVVASRDVTSGLTCCCFGGGDRRWCDAGGRLRHGYGVGVSGRSDRPHRGRGLGYRRRCGVRSRSGSLRRRGQFRGGDRRGVGCRLMTCVGGGGRGGRGGYGRGRGWGWDGRVGGRRHVLGGGLGHSRSATGPGRKVPGGWEGGMQLAANKRKSEGTVSGKRQREMASVDGNGVSGRGGGGE